MQATPSERTEPLLPRWVWAPALCVCVAQCAAFYDLRRDDAFITYRYGQNLVLGRGLVFNVGERLMGSTSPGHVLLSSAMYALFGKALLPSVMSCLGCVGWTAQALAVGVLLRGVLEPWGAWLVALAVAFGAARTAEFVSMETNLVAACLLWAIVMARERRWYATAALSGLAALLRPDMYVPAILLGALCVRELRAQAFRPSLVFIGIAAPWSVFALTYFGHVLPQSAVTKYNRTPWPQYARFEFDLAASLVWPFEKNTSVYAGMWGLALFGAAILIRRSKLWLLPLCAALHYAAYLYIHPFCHHWHLYPANLIFVVLSLVGVVSLFGYATKSPRLRALGAVLGCTLTLFYARECVAFARAHTTAFWYGARDTAYRDISAYLLTHARPSDVVASVEVGTLAYYTDMRMYDWGGLVTVHPVLRPLSPQLSWIVVDSLFRDAYARGMTATKRFDRGEFVVDVHSFALMEEATRVMLCQHPDLTPSQLQGALRPEFERELAELARAMETSGKRIDRFLTDRHQLNPQR